MSIESTIAKLELPFLQVLEVVNVQFREKDEPFVATIRAVHIFRDKVKYDVGLWLGDGSVDNPETETRIYNVDSKFVFSYK